MSERDELIDQLRYRPVATTAAQMRKAADLLERDGDEIDRLGRELAEAREERYPPIPPNGSAARSLGAFLADVLCEDQWARAEEMLLGIHAAYVALRAEAEALRKNAARMRGALEMLYPGLVLDLRYADADDDRDALQSRIDTVEEALVQPAIDAAIAKEQSHASK